MKKRQYVPGSEGRGSAPELERLQREVKKAERKRREAEKEERRARATQRVIESTVVR